MTWGEAAEDFVPEGSLRDIYVRHVSHDDWETLYRWLLGTYPYVFIRDGSRIDAPPSVQFIWQDRAIASSLLTLNVEGVRVNCHFFQSDDFELDLLPGEVMDQERFHAVSELMRGLGRRVAKQVVMCYQEGKDDAVFLEYGPEDDALTYHKPKWR